MTMTTIRKQVGGTHYNSHRFMPFDIIDEYGLDFYEGNAVKYLLRKRKGSVEDRKVDLEKAIHYIEEVIKRLEQSEG